MQISRRPLTAGTDEDTGWRRGRSLWRPARNDEGGSSVAVSCLVSGDVLARHMILLVNGHGAGSPPCGGAHAIGWPGRPRRVASVWWCPRNRLARATTQSRLRVGAGAIGLPGRPHRVASAWAPAQSAGQGDHMGASLHPHEVPRRPKEHHEQNDEHHHVLYEIGDAGIIVGSRQAHHQLDRREIKEIRGAQG